jgi:hypothetical protein
MSKGFIFTVDAMLALFMLSTLIVFSMQFLGTQEVPLDLSYTVRNLATVLEKDGSMARGEFIELRKNLNDLSGPYCSEIDLTFMDTAYLEVPALNIRVVKPFCTGRGRKETILRTFTYDYEVVENTSIVRSGYGIAKVSIWAE